MRPFRNQPRRREAQRPDDQFEAAEPCADRPQSLTDEFAFTRDHDADEFSHPLHQAQADAHHDEHQHRGLAARVSGFRRLRSHRVPQPDERRPDDPGRDRRRQQHGGTRLPRWTCGPGDSVGPSKAQRGHCRRGAVRARRGSLVADYRRDIDASRAVPARPDASGSRFEGNNYLRVFHRIELHGQTLGTVYVESDMQQWHARFKRYTGIVAVADARRCRAWPSSSPHGCSACHLGADSRSGGDHDRTVSNQQNFALRAVKSHDDEIGVADRRLQRDARGDSTAGYRAQGRQRRPDGAHA